MTVKLALSLSTTIPLAFNQVSFNSLTTDSSISSGLMCSPDIVNSPGNSKSHDKKRISKGLDVYALDT